MREDGAVEKMWSVVLFVIYEDGNAYFHLQLSFLMNWKSSVYFIV